MNIRVSVLLSHQCRHFAIFVADDMQVALRERYADIVLVEGIIDTFEYFAVADILREYWHPNQDFEVDAAVSELS